MTANLNGSAGRGDGDASSSSPAVTTVSPYLVRPPPTRAPKLEVESGPLELQDEVSLKRVKEKVQGLKVIDSREAQRRLRLSIL
ncbi:hypothetical protein TWF694_006603 [Orbilia ellipsospora]|uniref:Uncharacterized protein n=1 Tax=Orbilia ellipsospora TaxID=2528407 RepID=A0AAV9XKP7_9PEZI